MNKRIYMDHAATTPVDPEVLEVMIPLFTTEYGNPSSIHHWGQRSEYILHSSRETISKSLNCETDEIIFTSSGTESDNLALRGIALEAYHRNKNNHMIISSIEHPAIMNTAHDLKTKYGFELTILPVNQYGLVEPHDLANAIKENTILVSIMYANNEIGVIQPISKLSEITKASNILFHTDAVQAAGQLILDVKSLGVDLMSISGHKFYGPKGIGALYIKRNIPFRSTQTGGSQENGLRAGTENVPLIAGMAKALEISMSRYKDDTIKMTQLRNLLIDTILQEIPDCYITGHKKQRLPNNASFVFDNIDGNELIMNLDIYDIAASSGSACKIGNPEPSIVLQAIGLSSNLSLGSLRLSIGRNTNQDQVNYVITMLPKIISKMRGTP